MLVEKKEEGNKYLLGLVQCSLHVLYLACLLCNVGCFCLDDGLELLHVHSHG